MSLVKKLADILLLLEKEKGVERAVNEVVTLIEARKLTSLLPALVQELERRKTEEEAGNIVTVEIPFEISSSLLSEISKKIGGGAKNTRHVLNKSLIGGFRAQSRFRLYDVSIRKRLDDLKTILTS